MLETQQVRRERIAAEIRAAKARRKADDTDLAAAIDVTRSTFSRKLNGHSSFTADELLALADHLKVAPASLLGGAA